MVIQGEMTAGREIQISLTVLDSKGDSHDIPAVIDTGFSGFLTLPSIMIEALQLTSDDFSTVILGDGREQKLERYEITVIWDGNQRTITALRAEGMPLLGISLLYGMVATFYLSDGGPALLFRP